MRSTRKLWLLLCLTIVGAGFLFASASRAAACVSAAECDDGNECTQNRCINGACVFPDRPAGTACTDDGDDCTRDLCLLNAGPLSCQHPTVPLGSVCGDDGDECTHDLCLPQQNGSVACDHPPVQLGSPCDDEGNECTEDRCLPDQSGGVSCIHNPLPFGSACSSDDNPCTTDRCLPDQMNAIACGHIALQFGSPCPDDGNDCTTDACLPDQSSIRCAHNARPPGSACTDHSPCTQFDACDPVGTCVGSSPRFDCRAAGKASVTIKNNARSSVKAVDFKWLRGDWLEPFELGDPTASTGYTLCIFDGNNTLKLSASVPPGGQCGDDACWRAKDDDFSYKDALRLSDGVQKIRLHPGVASKSSIQVRGKGPLLPVPALPLSGVVTVQLLNESTGLCFASSFGTAKYNTDKKFEAKTP